MDGIDYILFLHLPKAAGTTLHNIIGRWFPSQWVAHLEGHPGQCEEQIRAYDPGERERLRFVTGHFQYGLHEHLPGRSSYVTLMRDPVANSYQALIPPHPPSMATCRGDVTA